MHHAGQTMTAAEGKSMGREGTAVRGKALAFSVTKGGCKYDECEICAIKYLMLPVFIWGGN